MTVLRTDHMYYYYYVFQTTADTEFFSSLRTDSWHATVQTDAGMTLRC